MSDPADRLGAALADRYRIERELGEGGMATVYLAHDIRHDRPVALKVLKPELAAVIGGERFLTEITTTAKLQHPHILPLFDSGEADAFLYYVMPYVEGESLRERLDREKQLGVEEAIRIARDVADALDYAHRHGVIHRDIKPANILLHDGRPVIADFGIAVAISAAGGGRLTETGMSVGTPHYMSPEQATAERDLSPRSDVYSLACVLYEMLAGDPPHVGPTAQAILMRILTEEARPVSDVRKAVPPHVSAVLTKGLEKLPADRFESAAEFADALADETYAYSRPARTVPAVAPAAPAATVAGAGVDRRLFAGVAAVAAAAVALGAWGWLRPPTGPAVPDAPTRLTIDIGDMSLDDPDEILVSPDGSRFAVVATVNGTKSLYWRRASEEAFHIVPGTEGAREATFSPNGEWIAYSSANGALLKVSLLGGAPTPLVPAGEVRAREASWSDDGTIVFGGPNGLFRVPDTGGQPERLFESSQAIRKPSLVPGGGVIGADRGGGVVYLAPGADSLRVLIPGGLDPKYIETGHLLYADAAGGLWAAPFDPRGGEVTGGSVPILDGLRVIRGVHARYSVSRNGTLVYGAGSSGGTSGGRAVSLALVDLDGRVGRPPLDPRDFNDFRWSPDGTTVVYSESSGSGNDDLFTYDVELGTTPRQLTFEGDNYQAVWSPDGTRVAFASVRDGSDGTDLYVKSVVDDSPPERLLALPGRQVPQDWPEDAVLVFASGAGPPDLWIADLSSDSAVAREYLPSENAVFDARVSPDRKLAAYVECPAGGGVCDVFVRGFPVPGARERVSDGGGRAPTWSPEGNTIYYWAGSGGTTLVAARVQRGPPFVVTRRDSLFSGPYENGDWDLHPDGDRLITTQSGASPDAGAADDGAAFAPERFLVVVNWFEELRERLGGR